MEIGVWLDSSTDSINDAVDQTRFVCLADQQRFGLCNAYWGGAHTSQSDAGLGNNASGQRQSRCRGGEREIAAAASNFLETPAGFRR
jgi:hypothetical protein